MPVPLRYMRKRNAQRALLHVAGGPRLWSMVVFGDGGEGSLHPSGMLLTLASYMVEYKWYPTLQPLDPKIAQELDDIDQRGLAYGVLQPSITGGERPMTRHSYGWGGVRRTS